jgi:hypothetical protein
VIKKPSAPVAQGNHAAAHRESLCDDGEIDAMKARGRFSGPELLAAGPISFVAPRDEAVEV